MRCPFCGGNCEEGVLACPACGRDVAVPAHLQKEYDHLVGKRDALRAELDRITTEVERYRRLRRRSAS